MLLVCVDMQERGFVLERSVFEFQDTWFHLQMADRSQA